MPPGLRPIPGLHFNTTMNDWHTCAGGRRRSVPPTRARNTCSWTTRPATSPRSTCSPTADADGSVSTSSATSIPVRLWTIVLEISVMMAQFPSKEIARAVLRIPHAGPRLCQYRRPADDLRHPLRLRRRAGRSAGALTAIMTGVAYATSAEMAAELGAFPDYRAQCASHMLRVMRNHRRAAYGERDGYEKLSVDAGAADRGADCPQPALVDHARAAWDRAHRARRGARLPQRAGDGDRADRHDRPGHGLRHHRHRARFRAGQVQEAGRRRLFQDHQPRRARGAAHARLFRGRDRRDRGLCGRPRQPRPGAGDQPRLAARPRASPTTRSRRSTPR